MEDDHGAFKVVALVMIVVSVVGVFISLSLTAQFITNVPETEIVTVQATDLLDCRSNCISTCEELGKVFEHGSFHDETYLCDCFCV